MYNRLSFDLKKVLDRLDCSVVGLEALLEEKDIWYPDISADGQIRYLRKIHTVEFISSKDKLLFHKEKGQTLKVGKFLGKFGAYEYDLAHAFQAIIAPHSIAVLTGNYIPWAYLGSNNAPSCGSLNSSCMRHTSQQEYFRIYQENARMVVTTKENLITARAILWDSVETENSGVITVVDRIYGNPKEVNVIKMYAESMGWYSKVSQRVSQYEVELKEKKINLGGSKVKLKVPLSNKLFTPWLDTFYNGVSDSDGFITSIGVNLISYEHDLQNTAGGPRSRSSCVLTGQLLEMDNWGDYPKVTRDTDTESIVCPICGEHYVPKIYGAPHKDCVTKSFYLCKDCKVIHIANSKEELKRKSCKGEEDESL